MDSLKHYGMPRRSGRYPWGSGQDPEQSGKSFLGYVDQLKRKGFSEVDIAVGLGISTTELRAKKSRANTISRREDVAMAIRLKEKGMSDPAGARQMGIPESTYRNLLNPSIQERAELAYAVAKKLKDSVAEKRYLDVGRGTESDLAISRTKLLTSLSLLEKEGYKIHYVETPQAGTDKKTSLKVLTEGSVTWKEVNDNKDKIRMVIDHPMNKSSRSALGLEPVKSVSSKDIYIRYEEESGKLKDGVIELRRGVPDLDLGGKTYAQVRIGVDDTHFLKGMAMYSDDIPDGYNIVFNTNKSKTVPGKAKIPGGKEVFKPMEINPDTGKVDTDNPFGSLIKEGGQRGALNIVHEEGDWEEWTKSISSQMLSKQPPKLIKKQLDLALAIKKEEFEEINSLTNAAVKKKLFDSFADDCDSASVHLKAAALPRQGAFVILPFPTMKPTEIYAPLYKDGESVVLIRYPHGGVFEIPTLTVNNRFKKANELIGRAADAVGIHPKVADQLSGADFDGDTVIVIPTDGKTIKTSSPLKSLQTFNAKASYPGYEGMKVMTEDLTGLKMGDISNLITDMTIKGAPDTDIAMAVRHSMVVIDAKKHKLDWKKSYDDHRIGSLKEKYQGRKNGGAATLISRASSQERVPLREDGMKVLNPLTGKIRRQFVNPKTGEKQYEYLEGKTKTGKDGVVRPIQTSYVDTRGRLVVKRTMSTKMAEKKDAFELSSGTEVENLYASYANELKSLGNKTRLAALKTNRIVYSPSAKKTYANEVASLTAQLNIALKNAPLERQAQLLANKWTSAKKNANKDMDYKTLQKIKGEHIKEARYRVGAKKEKIKITPIHWEAIQAGAVSHNVVAQILDNTDMDKIKEYATPRIKSSITTARLDKARAMKKSGYTQAEIAEAIGVSVSTLSKALK